MSRLAVVIGAGIAGLLAARVLAPHFEHILVLDRDALPDKPDYRSGTAQARHAHILLRRGLLGIERLLPGYQAAAIKAGAVMTNASRDWFSLFPMGALPRFDSDFEFLCATRPLIEHTLRHCLLAQWANVTLRDNCQLHELTLAADSPPQITLQPTSDHGTEVMTANLVVDATGRNSHSPASLLKQGFGQVRSTETMPYLGYASRLYSGIKLPPATRACVIMAKDPDMTRGGVLFPVENNQYICTLYGFSKDYPATDEAGFLAFAKSLRSDMIYRAIKVAHSLSPAKAFIKNSSSYYHYAESGIWPQGFLVLGDAVCSFNPIYGQGITAALLASEALANSLTKLNVGNPGWTRMAQRKIVSAYHAPWTISSNEDQRWPATGGADTNFTLRAMHRFSNRIGIAATHDQQVAYAYIEVLHMMNSPAALLTPTMLLRIFRHGLQGSV